MELKQRLANHRGQSLVEFALIMPFILLVALGVVEVSYALLDQHVVTKLSREGSNLISRDASLLDATNALKTMSTRPVDFDSNSRLILSVLKKVDTVGAPNFDKPILYARYEYGSFAMSSKLTTRGAGNFGGAPDFQAKNSDTDTNLQLQNFDTNLISRGGYLYVTEIFSRHTLITPFDRFGIQVPDRLYSIAYF